MFLLTSTTSEIRLITSTTSDIDVHASWVDRNGSTDTPGITDSAIASATTTAIVGSPAASTVRNVRYISIANKHATTANTVTVQHYNGTTAFQIINLSLKAGYTLQFNDAEGWVLIDASGGRIESTLAGRFLGSTLLTSATGTFTTTADTTLIRIRGVGGGGGGGGCTSVAAAAGGGGGGGAGGYIEKAVVVSASTSYSYTCGVAGSTGSAAAGGAGGNSTFVVGATTYTAFGGSGGTLGTAATTLTARAGGAGGVVSTNGDLNSGGAPGGPGFSLIVATPIAFGGQGGSSELGGGGNGRDSAGNGNAATGFGAGGGGAMTGASAARTGGTPTAGCWIVDEYT